MMSQAIAEVRGTLQADGTLVLDEKPNLPAGRVSVMIQALEPAGEKENPWTVLERIWAERRALGLQPRSAAEIDAEISILRDEWDEHQQALEQIQEEARRAREKPPC
jgi:hypothetical protein